MRKTDKIFKSSGIKKTDAREAIINILSAAKSPLNYDMIRQKLPINIDKATFYRNISLFEAANIVRKFESDDKKWYFELSSKSHAHFICESCHDVVCVDFEISSDIKEYDVKNVILKGVCKSCR